MKLEIAKLFFIEKMSMNPSDLLGFKQILTGYSNYIFMAKNRFGDFYLRISKPNHLINRNDEKYILDQLNIKYYYYDNEGNMIRDWFQAEHNVDWNHQKITSISDFLNKLHSIKINNFTKFNYKQYEPYIINTVFEHYYHLYLELLDKYKHLPLCVCHNDLNPTNLLYDGKKIIVLDYERAQLNTTYFDFANLAREDMGIEQIQFLCKYNELDFKVFLDHLVITCIYALQWTLFFHDQGLVHDYQKEVMQRLQMFLELCGLK